MATYAPLKPYGSRWNYRTPSPPPRSVIEPISPLLGTTDSNITLPENLTALDSLPTRRAVHNTTPSRPTSHEELRSDSTLSLLSSISSPSPPRISPYRRDSPTERPRTTSDVPTFAGNQYFDPLAFFADVALSSADPTTLPKLQQLAAKDAAQRLESSPEVSSQPDDNKNKQKRNFAPIEVSRRISASPSSAEDIKYSNPENLAAAHEASQRSHSIIRTSSAEIERVELAPARDLTPPSSNGSASGNPDNIRTLDDKSVTACSIRPSQDVALPSPPLVLPTASSATSDDANKAFNSSTRLGKMEIDTNATIIPPPPNTAQESTSGIFNIEDPNDPNDPAEQNEQVPKTVKGKKKGGRAKASSTKQIPNSTTPKPTSGSKKAKIKPRVSTPSIALRRSTRNIKYIEEPEPIIPQTPHTVDRTTKNRASVENTQPNVSDTLDVPNTPRALSSEYVDELQKAPLNEVNSEVAATSSETHTGLDIEMTTDMKTENIDGNQSNLTVAEESISSTMVNHPTLEPAVKEDSSIEQLERHEGQEKAFENLEGNEISIDQTLITASSNLVTREVVMYSMQEGESNETITEKAGSPAITENPTADDTLQPFAQQVVIREAHSRSFFSSQPSREQVLNAQAIVDALQQGPLPLESMSTSEKWSLSIPVRETRVATIMKSPATPAMPVTPAPPEADPGMEVPTLTEAEALVVKEAIQSGFSEHISESMDEIDAMQADEHKGMDIAESGGTSSEPLQVEMDDEEPEQPPLEKGIQEISRSASTVSSETPETSKQVPEVKAERLPLGGENNDLGDKSLPVFTDDIQSSGSTTVTPNVLTEVHEVTNLAIKTPGLLGKSEAYAPEEDVDHVSSPSPSSPSTSVLVQEPTQPYTDQAKTALEAPPTMSDASGPLDSPEDRMEIETALCSRAPSPDKPVNVDKHRESTKPESDAFEEKGFAEVAPSAFILETTQRDVEGEETSPKATDEGVVDTPSSDKADEVEVSTPTEDSAITRNEAVNATQSPSPESPAANDVCLVCKSSAFLLKEVNPVVGESSSDPSSMTSVATQWIQCDECKLWTHNACANLTNEEVEAIDKYHCPTCEKEKGPSTLVRKSSRPKAAIDYESLNNGSAVPSQSATNKLYHPYVDKILSGEFNFVKENFPRVVPEELSLQFFEDGGGFRLPIVIPAAINPYPRPPADSEAPATTVPASSTSGDRNFSVEVPVREGKVEVDRLGMSFPPDLTIRKVVELVGPDELVEVIDVKSQQGDKKKWPLSKWVEYFEDPNRERIYNVLSLEVSRSKLGKMIQRPKVVRDMDLSDQVWPNDKMKEFPSVQYYCLMSVAHAYTDWHIDFGGSSVYYRILRGRKVFFFLKPTKENLEAYRKWTTSPEQSWTWLAEGKECYRIDLGPGDTMLIPSGWIHAVYTPEDSLVIGGNFLTRLHYDMQFAVHEIEKANNTPIKYRFPRFARVHWYDAIKLIEEDPIPPQVDEHLLAGKAANFRMPKGKGNATHLSDWVLEGLPAFAEFLRRNSLIAQEIITEGLTKQKTEAVRNAIPKGYGDGWGVVQTFARWATWKRNAGEVIPSWAYPGADPAEGVPNAGHRKLSAAALKHMERAKADAERRALGAVRPGLRERHVSSQVSPSVSNTPVPEESRVNIKKRMRESIGDPGPPRKRGKNQKEKLDQAVIDECVKEVIAEYEASNDVFKRAMAVEVQTQYRNVHITRLGPSRSACAPCREGKTKCVHKDEIRTLITAVMDLYHVVKGTPMHERQQANEEYHGTDMPEVDGERTDSIRRKKLQGEISTPGPRAGSSHHLPLLSSAGPSVKRALNNQTFITPKPKKLQKLETPGTEPRRRGGKRTACDACRKSRRKCLHGIQGQATPQLSRREPERGNDEDAPSGREETPEDKQPRASTALSPSPPPPEAKSQSPPEGKSQPDHESSPLAPQVELQGLATRYATPAEQLRAEETEPVRDGSGDQEPVPKPEIESPVPTATITARSSSISSDLSEASPTPPSVISTDVAEKATEGKSDGLAGGGEKRRAADDAKDYINPSHSKNSTRVTPSPSKRIRPTVPQFVDGFSPKKARENENASTNLPARGHGLSKVRTTPRRTPTNHIASAEQWISSGSDCQNTPEKIAWQEIKAAEFGLRNRSKSKSSS